MRQYPIWVDMVNNSYNSSKSYGVNDYNIQHVMVGTSSRNSYDFAKIEMGVVDTNEDGTYNEPKTIKTYSLYVDGELIKQARYNTKTKKATIEDLGLSYFSKTEKDLKAKYFKKWKDEDEAKDQAFRNERYAHRLAVNGQ